MTEFPRFAISAPDACSGKRARERRFQFPEGNSGGSGSIPVAEKPAFLDDPRHFRRHHRLPMRITFLQFGERVRRMDVQIMRIIIS